MSYCLYQHVQNGRLYNASLSCVPPEERPKPTLLDVPSLQAGLSSTQRWLILCAMTGEKLCRLYTNLFRKTVTVPPEERPKPTYQLFLLHRLDLQALSVGDYCCLYQHVQKDSVPPEGKPAPTLPDVPSPHAGP